MLDAYPDAISPKPYKCEVCKNNCGSLVNNHCCIKCYKDMRTAKDIFNSDKSPLDFMIESAVSVGYASSVCERCGKKFRFYRKEHLIYDKTAHKYHAWKQVCIDCINLESDSF